MKELIIELIGATLLCGLTFIFTSFILSLIFWCFGISFSLKIALGIWLVLFLLYLFIKVLIITTLDI